MNARLIGGLMHTQKTKHRPERIITLTFIKYCMSDNLKDSRNMFSSGILKESQPVSFQNQKVSFWVLLTRLTVAPSASFIPVFALVMEEDAAFQNPVSSKTLCLSYEIVFQL